MRYDEILVTVYHEYRGIVVVNVILYANVEFILQSTAFTDKEKITDSSCTKAV